MNNAQNWLFYPPPKKARVHARHTTASALYLQKQPAPGCFPAQLRQPTPVSLKLLAFSLINFWIFAEPKDRKEDRAIPLSTGHSGHHRKGKANACLLCRTVCGDPGTTALRHSPGAPVPAGPAGSSRAPLCCLSKLRCTAFSRGLTVRNQANE